MIRGSKQSYCSGQLIYLRCIYLTRALDTCKVSNEHSQTWSACGWARAYSNIDIVKEAKSRFLINSKSRINSKFRLLWSQYQPFIFNLLEDNPNQGEGIGKLDKAILLKIEFYNKKSRVGNPTVLHIYWIFDNFIILISSTHLILLQ